MLTQVTWTCSKHFATLRQVRSIWRSVSKEVLQSLLVALVFSRFYYGSASLAGLLKQLLDRLQSVQNAAARSIFSARRQNHVQPLLCSLHWLQVPERILFPLAVVLYRCFHGATPSYLASELQHVSDSDLNTCRRLRSSSMSVLVTPRTLQAATGDCAFPAAAASIWNSLPESVRASASLPVFHSKLKIELFARSYSLL